MKLVFSRILRALLDWLETEPEPEAKTATVGPPPKPAQKKDPNLAKFPPGVAVLGPLRSGLVNVASDECWFGLTLADMAKAVELLNPPERRSAVPDYIECATKVDFAFVQRVWVFDPYGRLSSKKKAREYRIEAHTSRPEHRSHLYFLSKDADVLATGRGGWHISRRVEAQLKADLRQTKEARQREEEKAAVARLHARAEALFAEEGS